MREIGPKSYEKRMILHNELQNIGITQRKYSYIETGTQQFTDEILCKLADLYKTTVDYILYRTDNKQKRRMFLHPSFLIKRIF